MADSEEERSVEEIVSELESRIDTLEDKVMMERLEDLALEDKLKIVQDLVERDEETVKEKLEMLDQIEEEYEETQVEEKLQYLYKELKSLKSNVEELSEGQVQEDDLNELRGRIDRLQSRLDEESGTDEEELDDIYDKIYTLRDRLKELTEEMEESEYSLSDSEIDDLVSKVESRVDTGDSDGSDASAIEIKEEVLEEIDTSYVSEKALDDLREEINSLSSRIDTHEELEDGGDILGDVRSRIAELEDKVEELENSGLEGSGDTSDIDSGAIEELRSELEELQDEISESAKEDLKAEIEAIKEKVEEHDERLSGDITPEIREDLSETQERVEAIQQSLEEEISHLKEEDIQPLKERLEDVETEDIDDIEDRIDEINERADDIEERLEINADELLEALEYNGDELEDRFKNILVQIEQLREMIGRQGERIDSLSHAQNIFESNIGGMMQEHRDFTEQLQREDRKLDRKTDLLLEALEEGIDIEAEELKEKIEDHKDRVYIRRKEFKEAMQQELEQLEEEIEAGQLGLDRQTDLLLEALENVVEEGDVDTRLEQDIEQVAFQSDAGLERVKEKISEMQGEQEAESLDHERRVDMLVEAIEEVITKQGEEIEELKRSKNLELPDDRREELGIEERDIDAIAEIAARNQERVQELQEKLEDMERHAPTIVE
ncbi:MAG: hypothetical protein MUP63_00095 [Candidatus Nanohaloarchaeota archaeon QJJ-7]|nr:hypothetical protein [Candidatus Nanohaloarchaeota archaeon QJJ-7]